MAGTSGRSHQFKLSDTMGGSDESVYLTAPAREARKESMMKMGKKGGSTTSSRKVEEQIERSKAHWSTLADQSGAIEPEHKSVHLPPAPASEAFHATTSSSSFLSVEEQIERSKAHWSELANQSSGVEGEEVAEESNKEEFKALQMHPVWGSFFQTFGYALNGKHGSQGELVVGEKFAEGGQAELYAAKVKWSDSKANEMDVRNGCEWVIKVFKKGTFLKHLTSQLPLTYLQDHAQLYQSDKVVPNYCCRVYRGTLLKDGRFGFLMQKGQFDLRRLIECNISSHGGGGGGGEGGPFAREEAESLMYHVALGVEWLHSHDIVHRDLKASNVLVNKNSGGPKWACFVSDYECSVGVVGTGFFKAPEILQACKDGKVNERPEVFSRAADIYSYGMTCYEILTGKLPFENHLLCDNYPLLTDLVINQHLRPEVPEYIGNWTRELLGRCWQSNPKARPTIGEILNLLSANSAEVRSHGNAQKI